jgi:hypothetical protein
MSHRHNERLLNHDCGKLSSRRKPAALTLPFARTNVNPNGDNLMSFDELKPDTLKLNPEERAEPAQALLLSLDELPEGEIQRLWLEEAVRRDEEAEAGQVSLRTAEDVFRDARARLSPTTE